MRIEVFSDVVCPWCFIGTRRLARAVATVVGEGLHAPTVELHPFQLDPGAPDVPSPVVDSYVRKFGDRAPGILRHVTEVARADGIELHFDRALRANTARAHRLLGHALVQSGPAVQWELSDLLFRAYFEEGCDIGDTDTLVGLAERAGVDGAAHAIETDDGGLGAALARASDLGITAVPTFVVDGQWSVPGAQDTETFVRILRRLAA